jgi:hypothetical protein
MVYRVVCLLFAASFAFAQSYQGEISGVVTDASGAVVPGAGIELTHNETGLRRNATTDAHGRFYLVQLPTGPYRLQIRHTGFRTFERTLTIEVGARDLVDVKLEVGTMAESLQVDAEAPLIEAATGALGTVVDNTRISNLPLNGRNAFELVALTPGVVPMGIFGLAEPFEKRAQAAFSAGGSRGLSNEILLDGAPVTGSSEFNMPLNSPPLEAIQEFRVQLNSYSAEFGRTQGAVVNSVTRSGTNKVHGAIYDYLRNDNLDANSFFNNAARQPKADLRWNQFGAALGGPVVFPRLYNGRNRSFIFLSYEGMRYIRGVSDLRRVPTPLESQGDFSQTIDAQRVLVPIYDPYSTRLDPARPGRRIRDQYPGNRMPASVINAVARRASRYYPAPNQAEMFPSGPNYFFGGNLDYRSDRGIAKYDHNFSERHRSSFRYSQLDDLVQQPLVYGNLASPTPGPQHQFSYTALLEHTWVARPTLVANAKLSLVRFGNDLVSRTAGLKFADELGMPKWLQERADFTMFPTFNVGNMQVGPIGPPTVQNRTTNWNPSGSLTWVKGPHNVKSGFDWRVNRWNQFLPNAPSGNYTFIPGSTGGPDPDAAGRTGSALASFLLGTPSAGSFGLSPRLAIQNVYAAFYVQDDWRVSGRLTLNLGLRWDYEGARTERFNRMTWLDLGTPSPIAQAVNTRYAEIRAQFAAANPATAAVLPATLGLRGGLRFAGPGDRRQMEPDSNNFGPRFGFAFKAAPQWVVRGGFGIFFAPQSGDGISPSDVATGFLATTSLAGFGADRRPLVTLSDPFPQGLVAPTGNTLGLATNVGAGITSALHNNRVGYVEQWNLNIQRMLGGRTVVEAGYIGSHGVKLFGPNVGVNLPSRQVVDLGPTLLNTVIANPFAGVVPANTPLGQQATTTIRQLLLPLPHFTAVTSKNQNLYNSNYHALAMRLERRVARGFAFLVSYTAGKSIDDGSGWNEGVQGPLGTTNIDVSNRRLDRAISTFDRSQRLVATFTYRLPFRHRVFGGWQLNLISTFMTGAPLALGRTAQIIGDVHSPDNGRGRHGVSTDNPWMNPAAFRALTTGEVSNIPRTLPDLRGPGTANTDFSLLKEFRLYERLALQFRAEAFNAFNRTELGLPNAQPQSATFGLITSTRQRPREIQLGLRLQF